MTVALIADDEPLMRASLREHLSALWPELQVVQECADGIEALASIRRHVPDLAFLDIHMPGMNGLQVAGLVPPQTRVVFVTAHDHYALQAFEAHAVDYIVKPIDVTRLARALGRLQQLGAVPAAQVGELQRAIEQVRQAAKAAQARTARLDWLQIDSGRQVQMVHVDDVMYFESDHKYTRVVAEDCDGLVRLSLKELLGQLDDRQYLQVHRRIVVNRRFIRSVARVDDAMELELRGRPERLRVSESNHHRFRAM